jgi:hypothetical protein
MALIPGTKYMVSVGNKSYPVTLRADYYLETPGQMSVPEWRGNKLNLGTNAARASNTVRNLTQKSPMRRNNTRRNNTPPSRNNVQKASRIMTDILTRYNDNEGGYRLTLENAIKMSNERFGSNKMNAYFKKEYAYLDPDGSVFATY